MKWSDFLKMIKRNKNADNIESVVRCAEKFHRHAGIEMPEIDGDVVVETGHQPNFLPHSGTFKKAFMANFLKSIDSVIPLFGIYDYNPATARLLYQNRVPDINKNGFKKIGFKLDKKDALRRFDQVEKPSRERWMQEIEKINEIYSSAGIDWIIDEMEKSYKLGKSFADVNAILFARICNYLDINKVIFFKYSDLQKRGVFLNEWMEISKDVRKFNRIYNAVVTEKKIPNGRINELTMAPFWYLCECGGNTPVYYNTIFTAKCPICKTTYEFNSIEEAFDRLSPRAVFRNLVFSKGLNTSLFISGSGGSLIYGQISNKMYSKFGIEKPLVAYWKSSDYYLSPMRRKIIYDISKLYGEEFFKINIKRKRAEWIEQLKSDKKFKGYYQYSHTLIQIAEKVFSLNYSIIDLLASANVDEVAEKWRTSLDKAVICKNEFYSVVSDVDFGGKNYYNQIIKLANESKVEDPAKLLGGQT